MDLIRAVGYCFIGYVLGVWFNPDIFSAHLDKVDWYNIWIWAWVLLWPFGLIYHFFIWAGVFLFWCIVVCVAIAGIVAFGAWWSDQCGGKL